MTTNRGQSKSNATEIERPLSLAPDTSQPSSDGPAHTAPDEAKVCTSEDAFTCDTQGAHNVTATQFDVPIVQLLEIFELLRLLARDHEQPQKSKKAQQPRDPRGEGVSN